MQLKLKPPSPEAYQLLHEGRIAFAEMEADGIRIDTAYLDQAITNVSAEISGLEDTIRNSEMVKVWAREFGEQMNLTSRQQLGQVVFDVMGRRRNPFMGQSNSVGAFEHLKDPIIKDYHEIERLKKALSTNLQAMKREMINGYLHPMFNLHTAKSYRSSSERINFQNQQVRNRKISELVRSAIIFRDGHEGLEFDFNAHEVRVSWLYHHDENLRNYVLGGGDMHKDMSQQLYMLSDEELGSIKSKEQGAGGDIRYCAKNMFVFAEFYGSYYPQRAPQLWDAISIMNLHTAQGVSLYDHLKSKGIRGLGPCNPEFDPVPGTFEYHVMEVERRMWQVTFPAYAQWKRDWWAAYNAMGGVNYLSGFCMEGVFDHNQVLCNPIQGTAFHILLWCLIQIKKELKARKARSKLIVQIHDSQLFDAHKRERDYLIELVHRVCLKEVQKHWPWIQIPLKVETEVCGKSWFDKKPLEVNYA